MRKVAMILSGVVVIGLISLIGISGLDRRQVSAACSALPSDKGTVTLTASLPKSGSYRVWARILAPNTSSNSYYLQIDDSVCGVVGGDKQIAANTWTWVDYKDGNESSKTDVTLNKGVHTVKLAGRESGVMLDAIMFADDTSCVPTGTGVNCSGASSSGSGGSESGADGEGSSDEDAVDSDDATDDELLAVNGPSGGSNMLGKVEAGDTNSGPKQKVVSAILGSSIVVILIAAGGLYIALRHPPMAMAVIARLRARWGTARIFGSHRIAHGHALPTEVFGPDDKK